MSRLAKTIISLVSAGLVAVAGILLYVFWPAITGTINDNKYYTAEDVQNSYDKGFDDGNKSETELTAEITYYKTLVDEYESEVKSLNKEIDNLVSLRSQNENTISELTSIKNDNQETIDRLQSTVNKNNEDIENYQTQISALNIQITTLQNSNTNNQAEINNLRNQISNYQTMINQLQNTNNMNIQTINTLNTQITSLNKQISELQFELNNNSGDVIALRNTIAELEKSIAYYESYIAELENESQVVATFEFDGSVYNIQIVNKGSLLSVTNPESTGKVVFNGWTINGEIIDLTTYRITTNTKFIADVTYRNKVTFSANSEDVKTEYVENGGFAIAPEALREGYEFDGWTVDGVNIVDISTYEINKDTTFVAVYTKLHTVSFVYEDGVVSTQEVRNGEYADFVNIDDTTYKQFNGWTINGAIVDVSNYKISSSTVFTASITYSYDVTFVVDEEIYNSQVVVENNFVLVPTNPKKTSYVFDGWLLNGEIVDLTTLRVNSNIVLVASFTYSPGGMFNEDGTMLMSWDEMIEQDYITVTDNVLDSGSNEAQKTITGYLKVPDGITEIDRYCFAGWKGLLGADIPVSVTRMGDNLFGNCTSLKELSLPFVGSSNTKNYGNLGWLFSTSSGSGTTSVKQKISSSTEKTYYIPTSLKKITLKQDCFGYGAFHNCGMLREVVFDCEITNIPAYAFYGCYGITRFVVPEGVTEIGEYAFYNLYNVKHFQFPSTLQKIAQGGASFNTSGYLHLFLPKSLVEMKNSTTNSGCFGRNTRIVVYCEAESQPSGWPSYYAWDYNTDTTKYETYWGYTRIIKDGLVYYSKGEELLLMDVENTKIESCVIDENVTMIGKYVFEDCVNLKYVKIPEGVTELSDYMFYNATGLESIDLPSTLKKINLYSFYGCTSLKSITIPNSVTEIQQYAFAKCTSLGSVYIPNSVITMSYKICYYSENMVIYCGSDAVQEGWNEKWNYGNDSSTSPIIYDVKFGYTYEEYLSETGAAA